MLKLPRPFVLVGIVACSLSFVRCSENDPANFQADAPVSGNIVHNNSSDIDLGRNDNIKVAWYKEDTFFVRLKDITIGFPGMESYEESKLKCSDTLEIELDLMSNFNQQLFNIRATDSAEVSKVRVYESYRNSVTIPNEGPHMDLLNWKRFESGWLELSANSSSTLISQNITESEQEQFPPFTKEELIEAISKEGSEEWVNLIKKPYSGNWKEAYSVGTSLRRLKIEFWLNGVKQTRLLLVSIPMGC